MERYRFKEVVDVALERGYLAVRTARAESPQCYFEAARAGGRPCVIAVGNTVELFAPLNRKLSSAAQARIRRIAHEALTGSRSRRPLIVVDADGGVIRGVRRREAATFAGQVAEILGDAASYYDHKVIALHARTGGAA